MNPAGADRALRVRFRAWLAFVATLLGVFAFVVWPRLTIETDIVALLPSEQSAEDVNRAVERFSQALARKVIVLVGAPRLDAAKDAARPVAQTLRDSGAFATVDLEVRGRSADQLALYRAHRAELLAGAQSEALRAGGGERLLHDALRAAYTPAGLASPLGIAADPLGLATAYLQQQLPT